MKEFLRGDLKDKLLIGLIPFVLVLFWFRNGDILGGVEAELPFYKLSSFATPTAWSWGDAYLGYATGLTTASFPTWWVLSQLQNLGVPGFIIQAFVFWSLFFSAGIGVYLFTKILFPDISEKFLLIAVLFYWFNPISFINVWNRFLINFMFFWALLPLASYFFIKGLKTCKSTLVILMVFTTLLFSYVFSSVVFTLLLWFWFMYIVFFFLIFFPGKKLFYFKYTIFSLILFLLLHYWWISQYLSYISSSSLSTSISHFFSTGGNLYTLAVLSDKLGKLVYTFRFLPGNIFSERLGQTLFGIVPLFNILQYAFTLVILWVFYRYRKNREIILLSSFYFLILFLIKGQNAPFGEIFSYIFTKFTAFQVFRNPFEKFSFLLLLPSAIIFTFGIWKTSEQKRLKKFRKIIYLISVIFIIAVWGFPFYTGRVFTWIKNDDKRSLVSYEVRVPDYYKDINKWLNRQKGEFRFISLPLAEEGMTYDWEKPYSGVELSRNLFDKPNISYNTTIPFYNNLVTVLSRYQLNKGIFSYLPFINDKYILWRSDIDFRDRRVADPATVKKTLDIWINDGYLNKTFEEGKLAIYELEKSLIWPKIYVTRNIVYSNRDDFAKITIDNNTEFLKNYVAILSYKDSYSNSYISSENLDIVPTKVFLPNSFFVSKKFNEQDLLARLFHAEHLPTERLYPLVRLKEVSLSPPREDEFGQILYKTGILGKRAVEVYKLYLNKSDQKIISRAEADYLKALTDFRPYLSSITSTNKRVAGVSLDSLIYQYLLLDKISADNLKKVLMDVLLQLNIIYKFELPLVEKGSYLIYHFEIPKPDRYHFQFDKSLVFRKWFLDGRERSLLKEDGSPDLEIYLTKGLHELAVNVNESDFLTNEVNLGNQNPTNKSNYRTVMNLPDLPTKFQVDFDYRFTRGNYFKLNFKQNIDRESDPILNELIIEDPVFHGWKHVSLSFNSKPGAEYGYLETLPRIEQVCKNTFLFIKSCLEKPEEYEMEIRNLRIRQIHYPELSLSSSKNFTSRPSTTIWQWVKINPALYALKINKKDPGREVLVFSELYDPRWKLYPFQEEAVWNQAHLINEWQNQAKEFELNEKKQFFTNIYGKQPLLDDRHYLANLYANSWIIDKSGNYEFLLMFAPQQDYYLSMIVSALGILFGSIYLLIKFIWRKRNS